MGQRQSDESEPAAEVEAEAESAESPYDAKDVSELHQMVCKRGLTLPQDSCGQCSSDRAVLTTLLLAYDAGMSAAAGASPNSSEQVPSPGKPHVCPSALRVLQRIRDSPGHMGVDIGGTLVKMAIALPAAIASEYDFPAHFGQSGRTHSHLQLELRASGTPFLVRFVSGSTFQMEQAVQQLGLRRNRSWAGPQPAALHVDKPSRCAWTSPPTSPSRASAGQLKAKAVSIDEDGDTGSTSSTWDHALLTAAAEEEEVEFTRNWSDWSDVGTFAYRPVRRIAAAGGGACKFAPLFRDALRVEIEQVKELSAVVDGLLLLANHHDEVRDGQPKSDPWQLQRDMDLFTIDEDGRPLQLPWPEPLFPLILVNMGSGVSILRVDSARCNDYVRVGGTACGGGTFLGLARALTSATSFEEALALAERGDASKADKLVRDIYGEEGSASLGLAGSLTASNFGKLSELPSDGQPPCSEQDLARALLQMVTQQSVLLATAFAKHANCLDRVFFVGGFVDEPNRIARSAIAANFRSLGGCAYFLRHSDFLGALGSLRCAFQEIDEHIHDH